MKVGTASTLARLLEENARARPSAPALLAPGQSVITHEGLYHSACVISLSLVELGAAPGSLVALSLPEGPGLAAALLGTSCAHVAVPVGHDLPLPEARALLTPLEPAALVVERAATSALRDLAAEACLPLLEVDLSVIPKGVEPPARNPDDAALILHTSGTTGRPKPVPLTHTNLGHAASWVARSLALAPEDRCLNLMPLVHSHGLIGALLSSLSAGGSVLCTERPAPREMLAWASQAGCTWTTASPTVLRLMLNARGTWPGLRFLRSASAPMPPELAAALEERFRVPQIQVYGMTEAYQVAANPLPPGERRHGSVGQPTGCEIMVLGEAGTALGVGEDGEIALRGTNVFEGYGLPGATRERDAFAGDWFRTGDLGHLDAEGYLHITGRLGERINRGGEKIAPRAVENVLTSHADVAEALCFPVPDDQLGEEIGALVRPRAGRSLDPRGLRRFAATRLAPTRVPRYFWLRDELPRPASGKLNRRTLAETLNLGPRRAGAHDTPSGAGKGVIEALREIWREQLALESPPRDEDRFFDLGGTSLGLVELVLTIERRFGAHLPLSALLEAPSLAELAERVEQGPRSSVAREIVVQREGFSVRLLPIQTQGDGPPLLFVAPAGGSVLPYFQLADRMPRERPFWGLQIDLERRRLRRPFSIPDLGEAFAEGIERLRPRAPVILGGWSFGALAAWDVAFRLRTSNIAVERVLALDTWALRYGPDPPRETLITLAANLVRMVRESRPLLRDALCARLARSAGQREERRLLRALRARLRGRASLAPILEKDPRLAELNTNGLSIVGTLRHYLRAARSYEPPRFALSVDVLKAESSSEATPTLGWEHLSRGEVRGRLVPGDHFTLLTPPHVEEVARVIAKIVSGAR